MALTIKSVIRIFLLFSAFVLITNIFVEMIPENVSNLSSNNQDYLNFLNTQVNGQLDTEATGNTLLTNFKNSIEVRNLFTGDIASKFLGVLQVIGSVIWFVASLILNILFVPSVMVQILLYNFIASSTYLFAIGLFANVSFYLTMFYIIFKRRISQ